MENGPNYKDTIL